MARMLCVLFMIFVHVPDGLSSAVHYTLGDGGFAFFLEGFLVEGPGRASAALLSVVSGYLAATTLLKPGSSVWLLYRRRFVSIIVPMIIWAIATYLIYLAASRFRPTFLDDAQTLLDHLNFILFLTAMPDGATMHLGFLRDLFVCVLLSPLLLPAVQRMAWLVLPLLGLLYLFEHDQSTVVILRPLVLFAFCIGIYLAVRKVSLNSLDRFWPLFLGLSVVATMAILLVNSGAARNMVELFAARDMEFDEVVLYPIGRLFGSLAIWTLIPMLLGGRLQAWTERFTPYLFAAFCSHYLMLTMVFHALWSPSLGGRESTVFVVWFLAAPLLSMAIAVLIVNLTLHVYAPLATLLTGGRMSAASSLKPIAERRRQGLALGVWLGIARLYDLLTRPVILLLRTWFEASRRLLLGRR
ncbi:acyltransferase family protein [Granulosicoccus sp. 3-233]|uniref:acyltransferase family protein n=1 Tax=Granulosicoccus sp. 3-233 TaxID=3417969 RepID=UPI003D345E31